MLQLQDLAGGIDIHPPGVRDPHISVGPLEQRQADLPLDLLDILGEGRLGDAQHVGRPGERPLLGKGEDVLELFGVHNHFLRITRLLCRNQFIPCYASLAAYWRLSQKLA